ncbi:hypothetical protein HPB51_006582 [Rhipicephalus microplus]|uniref:Uncharacterized protein n=1 Tax=Rhipicephalus microplus TaxID=6941 RepID=A0A9J6E747_RHIMP|nr:hypothetical protein HPB51_006582 [Rhipicephalus microplus]
MKAMASCVTGLHRRRCQGRHAGAQEDAVPNASGVEGLNTYLHATEDEQQPGADRPTQETTPNVYDAALVVLNKIFDPQSDAAFLCAHFKALRQGPDQLAVEFIHDVRRVAKLCEFSAAGDIFAFDQTVSGNASPHLQSIFLRWARTARYRRHSTLRGTRSASTAHCYCYLEHKSTLCHRIQFKMTAQLAGLFKMPGILVAVLSKLRCKMVPAGLLFCAKPRPPLLRTPPLQLCHKLAQVLVTAAARRDIGPTPPLALPGARHVCGADVVDTSRGSAALLQSRPVIMAHGR